MEEITMKKIDLFMGCMGNGITVREYEKKSVN